MNFEGGYHFESTRSKATSSPLATASNLPAKQNPGKVEMAFHFPLRRCKPSGLLGLHRASSPIRGENGPMGHETDGWHHGLFEPS